MKKKKSLLITGIIMIIFSVTTIALLILNLIPGVPSDYFLWIILFFLSILIYGAMEIKSFFIKKEPHYHWYELKEKQIFSIQFIGPEFENLDLKQNNNNGYLVVFVKDFGLTLLEVPMSESYWGKKTPKKDEKYMLVDNQFRQII